MAELRYFQSVIRALLRLLLSQRNEPQLLLQEMRREAFPVISNAGVLGHVCVSLPFIFWIIFLFPGLSTSFALSLLPLELRGRGRVFWGQTLTSFQDKDSLEWRTHQSLLAPSHSRKYLGMFRAGWAELLAKGAGSPRAVLPEEIQSIALQPLLGLNKVHQQLQATFPALPPTKYHTSRLRASQGCIASRKLS